MNDLENQFLEAVRKVSVETLRCEISDVLNEIPLAINFIDSDFDKNLINEIDQIINKFYQQNRLTFPAHKWISGPLPESSLGRLSQSFEFGSLYRDSISNSWNWRGRTTYFCMLEFDYFEDIDETNN